jgi:uncharacterized membrane protein
MKKGRMEAFSDGVLAIIITIMVLEMRAPEEPSLEALRPLAPVLLSYVLSFVYLGIYWNNHHHLLQVVEQVDGRVLWANLHLLFWLSLTPFVTAWMGENNFATWPVVLYGGVLLLAAIAYAILTQALLARHAPDSTLRRAVGADLKGWSSLAIYAIAIGAAFFNPWLAFGLYTLVAVIWIVPDQRIERLFSR